MTKRRSEADRRARQSQRIGRALRLLCLIQDRHGRWDLQSLARELGCSTKTVQRDLLALEDAKIPFFYDKQTCCYRIRPGFRLSFLDDPSNRPPGQKEEVQDPESQKPLTPVKLAEWSRESAERLLSEAEALIDKLSQLCRSLRQADHPPGSNGPKVK
jgi:hypothetical protein